MSEQKGVALTEDVLARWLVEARNPNDVPTGEERRAARVIAARLAAQPVSAQALADDFAHRAEVYEAHPEHDTDRYLDGFSSAMRVAEKVARDAQPVPAPARTEATWHHGCTCEVAPEWSLMAPHAVGCPFGQQLAGMLAAREAKALREAADDYYGRDGGLWLRVRADRILRDAQSAEG